MRKIDRRIEELECRFGLSDPFPLFVHTIKFIDSDGTLAGTMVVSSDPKLCVPYRDAGRGNQHDAQTRNAARREPSGAERAAKMPDQDLIE